MKSDRIRLRLANNELCAHEVFKSARVVGSCTCQPERHITVKLVFVKISLSQTLCWFYGKERSDQWGPLKTSMYCDISADSFPVTGSAVVRNSID